MEVSIIIKVVKRRTLKQTPQNEKNEKEKIYPIKSVAILFVTSLE